jgi:integrase
MRLSQAIAEYLIWKREAGAKYERTERCLRSFCRHTSDLTVDRLANSHLVDFVERFPVSTATWRLNYFAIRHFLEFLFARRFLAPFAMQTPKPHRPQTFIPYIYSVTDVQGLIRATAKTQSPACVINQKTVRMLLIVLYSTGARIGEVLAMRCGDVNLRTRIVTFRRKNLTRSRQVPIGGDLHRILGRYMAWRRPLTSSDPLFVARCGSPILYPTLTHTFGRLRRAAGIARHDGSRYQPRIDDLRYTFAVHRIKNWLRSGADLNCMLPALAAYMGQDGLGSTERYLEMTPERFAKHLSRLSPTRRHRHWKTNKSLMAFLYSL